MPKPEPELTAIAEALQIDVRTLRNWRKRDGNGEFRASSVFVVVEKLARPLLGKRRFAAPFFRA